MKIGFLTPVLSGFLLLGSLLAISSDGADVDRLTPLQLKERLDSPDTVVLDVRTGGDWKQSEFKIKGAIREDPSKLDVWADRYAKDAFLVLY